MPLSRRRLRRICLALSLTGCAAPQPPPQPAAVGPLPQSAPVPGPPGHLSLEERIYWWEARIPTLPLDDRSEAALNLGEAYVEARRPNDARRALAEAQSGPLSRFEQARYARALGLSYLLEQEKGLAVPYLEQAAAELEDAQGEECTILVAWLRAGSVPEDASPLAMERLRPYFGGEFPQPPAPPLASAPAPAAVAVDLTRRDWGARPTAANHDPMRRIWRITVHHSAEPLSSDAREASIAAVRLIQQIHMGQNGWADIGYHYLIDRAGRVIEGRPLAYQGAHASGDFNRGNIGICLLGNFAAHPEDGDKYAAAQSPTAAQLATLGTLVDDLRRRYQIKVGEVWPHKHFRVTECPGPVLERWVADYRRSSAGLAAGRAAP